MIGAYTAVLCWFKLISLYSMQPCLFHFLISWKSMAARSCGTPGNTATGIHLEKQMKTLIYTLPPTPRDGTENAVFASYQILNGKQNGLDGETRNSTSSYSSFSRYTNMCIAFFLEIFLSCRKQERNANQLLNEIYYIRFYFNSCFCYAINLVLKAGYQMLLYRYRPITGLGGMTTLDTQRHLQQFALGSPIASSQASKR